MQRNGQQPRLADRHSLVMEVFGSKGLHCLFTFDYSSM